MFYNYTCVFFCTTELIENIYHILISRLFSLPLKSVFWECWLGQEFLNGVCGKYHYSRKGVKPEWYNNMKQKQNEMGVDWEKELLQLLF